MGWSLVSDKFLEIANQVVQLRHLDVILDHVARIKEADRLNVLFDGLIVLFLLKEFVCVLLDNLALDLSREVCLLRNGLSLSIV